MAGIFGFLQFDKVIDGEKSCFTLLQTAKQNFSHPSNYFLDKNENIALGYSLPYIQGNWPLTSNDGNYYFQLIGEIILPDGSLLDHTNFDDYFLNPFLKDPADLLTKIDGAFIFALYNKPEKQFTIVSDTFGNFTLHYIFKQNLFVFSSQMHGIIKVLGNSEWDSKALNQLLGLGLTLNGRTVYKNIFRLEPGTLLKVNSKGITTFTYSKPFYQPESNLNENINIIRQSIIDSIHNRLKNYDKIGAALTGGYDSRVTWGIINYLGQAEKVVAFTHGLPQSHDIRISKRIARHLKLNHVVQIIDDEFIEKLPELWNKFTLLNEGVNPITSAHALLSWESSSHNFKVLMDSHGGALYRRQYMKVFEKKIRSKPDFSHQIYDTLKTPIINQFLSDKNHSDIIMKDCLEGLSTYFDKLEDIVLPGDKIDLFYIQQVSGMKYSCAGNVQMNYVILAHPFLNLKAFNVVQKIPVFVRRKHLIYKNIVNYTSPELKHFPLENMGFRVPYLGFTSLRYIPMVYELILNKLRSALSEKVYQNLSLRRFVTDYDLFFSIHFEKISDILLRNNDTFFDIFDRKKIENFLYQQEYQKSYKLTDLTNLLSFKLYLDLFHK